MSSLSYIKNNLIPGERIEYTTQYHWIIFISINAVFTLFLGPIIKRWTDEFAITNKRVVMKTGLIKRDTFELNLSKIESVNVNQSILGRILNYGSVQIIGTGGSSKTFYNIQDPLLFRRKFQELC